MRVNVYESSKLVTFSCALLVTLCVEDDSPARIDCWTWSWTLPGQCGSRCFLWRPCLIWVADSWQLTLTLERRPSPVWATHNKKYHKCEAVRTFKTKLLRYKKSSCGYDGDKVKNSLPMWKPCNSSRNTQLHMFCLPDQGPLQPLPRFEDSSFWTAWRDSKSPSAQYSPNQISVIL